MSRLCKKPAAPVALEKVAVAWNGDWITTLGGADRLAWRRCQANNKGSPGPGWQDSPQPARKRYPRTGGRGRQSQASRMQE